MRKIVIGIVAGIIVLSAVWFVGSSVMESVAIYVGGKFEEELPDTMLIEGQMAPDFAGKDQDGESVKLVDYKGKRLVLYFYPRDMTPGCTKEACSFRDGFSELRKNNIEILGVSADDEESHKKFIAKHDLPFKLLADTDKKVSEKYGVSVEKNMYGKKYLGIKRTTFLIDEKGTIIKIFKKVNVSEHADEVLAAFSN